jgi:indolepyruvate ferredoxin oxidoreductase beta subunit
MRPVDTQAGQRVTNVLIVGVGGQGVVLISRMLARLCQMRGHQVKQSEVHGMAKRGGVVFSHLRYGPQVWSPSIPRGQADVLVALEWAEGLRWLAYLKPESGTFICDTHRIVPPFAFRNRARGAASAYAQATSADIAGKVAHCLVADATGMARGLGNPRAANTVLLGVLSTILEFTEADWLPVLEEFAPRGTSALNLQAFEAGRAWAARAAPDALHSGLKAQGEAELDTRLAGPAALEITDAWCKGCDICVKLCPERCLVLNGAGKVHLARPAACTGCRVCEMLCPDFAIRVLARPETSLAVAAAELAP